MTGDSESNLRGTFAEGRSPTQVLKSLAEQKLTGVFKTSTRLGSGECWLVQGRLVDAQLGTVQGELALRCMIGVQSGEFTFLPKQVERSTTISLDTDDILRRESGSMRLAHQLPALGTRLVVNKARISMRGALLELGDRQLLDLAAQGLSVFELVEASDEEPLDVMMRVIRLVERGFLRATASTRPEPSRPPRVTRPPSSGQYSLRAGDIQEAVVVKQPSSSPITKRGHPSGHAQKAEIEEPKIPRGAAVPRDLVPVPGTDSSFKSLPRSARPFQTVPSVRRPAGATPSTVPARVVQVGPGVPGPDNQSVGRSGTLIGGHSVMQEALREAKARAASPEYETIQASRVVSVTPADEREYSVGAPGASEVNQLPPPRTVATLNEGTSGQPPPWAESEAAAPTRPKAKWIRVAAPVCARNVKPVSRIAFQLLATSLLTVGLGASVLGYFLESIAIGIGGAVLQGAGLATLAVLVHRMWFALQDDKAPFSAGSAVGFLFIPVFGVYWMFRVWPGFATVASAFIRSRGLESGRLSRAPFLWSMLPGVGLPFLWVAIGRASDAISVIARHEAGLLAQEERSRSDSDQ